MRILVTDDDGINAPGLRSIKISKVQFLLVIERTPSNRAGRCDAVPQSCPTNQAKSLHGRWVAPMCDVILKRKNPGL